MSGDINKAGEYQGTPFVAWESANAKHIDDDPVHFTVEKLKA